LVYDLSSGVPVDWAKLLPVSFATTSAASAGADGTARRSVASPWLKELYIKFAHETDADFPQECDDVLQQTDLNFILWPDVKTNGLVLQQTDLPHVSAACGPSATIPMATLRKIGVDTGLLHAIEAGHKAAK
jgi:hypothetical protein